MVRLWGAGGCEDLGAWKLLGADRTGDEVVTVDTGLWDWCRGSVDCGGCGDWGCRYWCRYLGTWKSVDGRWARFDGIGPGGRYVTAVLAVSFVCTI